MIWVVRDFDLGSMMPFVSVWSERPRCFPRGEDGRVWLSQTGDLRSYLGSLWLQDAALLLSTVPDDEHQVIVMDRDPAKVRIKIDVCNGLKVPKP